MVKIGMLLPEERMVEPARKIIEENHLDVVYLEAVHTVDAVNKARIAVETGAHILVARGYQAKLIKEYTNIPVVEIRFHAQEIGLLIQKAKTILKKEHPHIALIAFENMLCDMSYMEQLFDIRLDVIYLKRIEEAESIIADFEERTGSDHWWRRNLQSSRNDGIFDAVLSIHGRIVKRSPSCSKECVLCS